MMIFKSEFTLESKKQEEIIKEEKARHMEAQKNIGTVTQKLQELVR